MNYRKAQEKKEFDKCRVVGFERHKDFVKLITAEGNHTHVSIEFANKQKYKCIVIGE